MDPDDQRRAMEDVLHDLITVSDDEGDRKVQSSVRQERVASWMGNQDKGQEIEREEVRYTKFADRSSRRPPKALSTDQRQRRGSYYDEYEPTTGSVSSATTRQSLPLESSRFSPELVKVHPTRSSRVSDLDVSQRLVHSSKLPLISLPPTARPSSVHPRQGTKTDRRSRRGNTTKTYPPNLERVEENSQISLSDVQSFLRERGFKGAASALEELGPSLNNQGTQDVLKEEPDALLKDNLMRDISDSDASDSSSHDVNLEMLSNLEDAESSFFANPDLVEQWQHSAGNTQQTPEHARIRDIFQAIMEFYSTIMPLISEQFHYDDDTKRFLTRNYHLLRGWGASYSVDESRLDRLGDNAKEMVDTILLFLTEICSILSERIFPLMGKWKATQDNSTRSADEQAQHLMTILQDLRSIDSQSDTSEYSSSDSSSEIDTLQQCAEDLHEYVQLLHEMHPSIEAFVPLSEDHATLSGPDHPERTASMIFADLIRSKFARAQDDLVNDLGQLNFDRYNRMAIAREHNLSAVEEVPEYIEAGEKSTVFHDSGLGSSMPSDAAPSAMAPSVVLPSISVPKRSTPSIAAPSVIASSLAFTLAGKSRSKLPRLPPDAGTKPFPCNFCGKTVSFTHRRDWEQHLLQDLLPYSCLEPACSQRKKVFASRKEWIKHLGVEHRVTKHSPPQLCSLCDQYTGSGRIEICKHYADHLEDIAIAASPLEVEDDEEEDADSNEPEITSEPRAPVLGVIEEESEEDTSIRIVKSGNHDPSRNVADRVPKKAADISWITPDLVPNCAICGGPAYPECPCESERLEVAVKQAEDRAMPAKLNPVEEFVIRHSREHILKQFDRLIAARKTSHTAYLATLPNYNIYIKYAGLPPIRPQDLDRLQRQIAEAHAELKRGVDADWRASVARYPAVLDYFFALVSIQLPEQSFHGVRADIAIEDAIAHKKEIAYQRQLLGGV